MAFKMKKPMFLGSPLHKSALKKAKSIVTPIEPGSDAGLVQSGQMYGESLVPKPIDYTLSFKPDIKFEKKKKKKEEEVKDNEDKKDEEVVEKTTTDNTGDEPVATRDVEIDLQTLPSQLPRMVQTQELDINTARGANKSINNINNSGGSDKFMDAAEKYLGPINSVEDLVRAEEQLQWDEKSNSWKQKQQETISVRNQIQPLEVKQDDVELSEPSKYVKRDTNYAHENPAYDDIAYQDTKDQRKTTDVGGGDFNIQADSDDPRSQPGYQFRTMEVNGKQKSVVYYNGHPVDIDELPPEISDEILPDGKTIRETYIDSNEKQSIKTNVKDESEPVTTTTTPSTTTTPRTTTRTTSGGLKNPRFNMSKYKFNQGRGGWFPGGKEEYEEDLKEYKSQQTTSAAQLRDDKIYKNAVPGGPVQMNMIKNGYVPK